MLKQAVLDCIGSLESYTDKDKVKAQQVFKRDDVRDYLVSLLQLIVRALESISEYKPKPKLPLSTFCPSESTSCMLMHI